MDGPGGRSASSPSVSFSSVIDGAGVARLTISQVTIDSGWMLMEKVPLPTLVRGRGASGESGVRKVQDVCEGSFENPGWITSVAVKPELPTSSSGRHWNVANPELSVVAVCGLAPGSWAFGRIQAKRPLPGAATEPSICQPTPGWASARELGSGVRSTILDTVTDGEHSWKAASRSASASRSKFCSRYTSSVVMSKSPPSSG